MPTHRMIIPAKVMSINPRTEKEHIAGAGSDAVFRERPIGWFVSLLDNNHGPITLMFGLNDKPPFVKGQEVKLVLEGEVAELSELSIVSPIGVG